MPAQFSADPLVSIVMPVYGVEKYLDEAVSDALAQTHRRIEVILVDDGSPDGCPAICDACVERDDRVRVIHQPNGGLSHARNGGMAAARGEYLYFMASDDRIVRIPDVLYHCRLRAGRTLAVRRPHDRLDTGRPEPPSVHHRPLSAAVALRRTADAQRPRQS